MSAQPWPLHLVLCTKFLTIFMSFYKYISVNTEDRWQETRLLPLLLCAWVEFGGEDRALVDL